MGIEQLKEDLEGVVSRCPSGPLTTAAEMAKYQKDDLLPILSGILEEISDMDAALGAVVEQSEDLLHEESAAVFAGIIESGRLLAKEIQSRPVTPELQKLVEQFLAQADEGEALLDEITYESPPEDPSEGTETEQ